MVYRICKRFTVESGHMLSKHPGRCRFPHGHTRTFEIVVSSDRLDSNDMVMDFKTLKTAMREEVERFDHAMAIHRDDPLLPDLQRVHPDSVIVFDQDPTTEVLAKTVFEAVAERLYADYGVVLESVRVWETPDSWAEVSR